MLNHVFNVSGGGGKEMKIRVDREHFERFQTEKAVYKSVIILIIIKKSFGRVHSSQVVVFRAAL